MGRRATMRQVAEHAGVSLKTVSRVVNGEAGVSPALLQRVESSVVTLGYRHNLAASNLRRGARTRSIGVLLQDVANDFSAGVLRAIGDAAYASGVAVFAASVDEEAGRERELVHDLASRQVDGLVLMPASDDQAYLDHEMRHGLSVVVVDRQPRGVEVDSVLVDNAGGARLAVEHLLGIGHRRVALIADSPSIHTSAARRDGYLTALEAHGVAVDPDLVRTGVRSEAQATEVADELLAMSDPPTAVFAARNVFSVGVVRALHRAGVQQRVALVGFDDFPHADLLSPAVSVISQSPSAVGRRAVELLLARIDDGDRAVRNEVLPTELLVRGSGEIAPPA